MSDVAEAVTPTPAPAEATTEATPAAEETTSLLSAADEAASSEAAPSEDKPGEAEAQEPEAPADYTFTLPEGVELDAATLDNAKALFREAKLPQEQAQKLVELGLSMQDQWLAQAKAAWGQTVEGWVEASKNDAEIGGARLKESLAVARAAIGKFGSAELLKALDQSGLGNHPEMIRFCAKVGRAISSDTVAGTTAPGAGKPSPEEILRARYDKSPEMFAK